MKTIQLNWHGLTVFFVIFIFLIQISITIFLAYKDTDPHKPQSRSGIHLTTEGAEKVFETMAVRADKANSIVDTSGDYRLFQNIWFGEKLNKNVGVEDVSIVTHSTVNNMHYLIQMSKTWQGPMSIVIFVSGQDLILALENIVQLIWCILPIRIYASFHLVSPVSEPARDIKPYSNFDELIACRWMERRMKKTQIIHNYAHGDMKYPNNLMRNFGIDSSVTGYIYVIDVDLIPSTNTRAKFLEFASIRKLSFTNIPLKREKIVYITPVFESTDDFLVPDNKFQLKRRYNKTLRPFYVEPCFQCQSLTDYERWLRLTVDTFLNVSYIVQWRYPYEPFYIVHRSAPKYNPLFKQYGFNRISQLCEVHMASYEFHVLNNVFLVHIGFKRMGQFHGTKNSELYRNKDLFNEHVYNLSFKYPNATNNCDVHYNPSTILHPVHD